MNRILVTGAAGQIGTELTLALRKAFGTSNVIASDIKHPANSPVADGPFEILDVTDSNAIWDIVYEYKVTQIYHLSAMLSATGEQYPKKGWELNMQSLLNVLEIANEEKLDKVFWPSSIAVFGPDAPKIMCGQDAPQRPVTAYGISKTAGELWCKYYHDRYGVDIRSIRYPGLISYRTKPGGGTTDYAVEIYHNALTDRHYTCYLKKDTRLPMMFMDDAVRAAIELMDAAKENITERTSYNLSAISFAPEDIAASIQKGMPGFRIDYAPDYRQAIADSWPASIDDRAARRDWGWKEAYDLEAITKEMLVNLSQEIVNDY